MMQIRALIKQRHLFFNVILSQLLVFTYNEKHQPSNLQCIIIGIYGFTFFLLALACLLDGPGSIFSLLFIHGLNFEIFNYFVDGVFCLTSSIKPLLN